MILGKILTLMMLSQGCDTAQCMEDYYTANQDSLVQIRALSDTLAENYAFERISIIKKRGDLEVMFIGGTVDNATMYIDPADLSLISEGAVEGCSQAAFASYQTMYNDTTLRSILQLFIDIEPMAIRITKGGVFVALGQALESPNVNLNGGILMPFETGFSSAKIVEEIDTNVYLFDALIY